MHAIHERIEAYDRVFNSGKLDDLAPFFAADATILDGDVLWSGFEEYRQHRLMADAARMPSATMQHAVLHVHVLDKDGTAAYVISKVTLVSGSGGPTARRSTRMETMVFSRPGGGPWVIRHVQRTGPGAKPDAAKVAGDGRMVY